MSGIFLFFTSCNSGNQKVYLEKERMDFAVRIKFVLPVS
uniref:Uncharacterized protein n=1 Tax=Rhizophora mucronata TaxID=61149 RepID=A0A2P2NEU3_RHIMU